MGTKAKSLSSENLNSPEERLVSPPTFAGGQNSYVAEIDEVRISNIVARKGWANILHEKAYGWQKKWVVCI